MSFDVYTAEYHGSPNHIFLFVATVSRQEGIKFHVIGNILQGMTYEKKVSEKPEESFEFVPGSMIRIGSIKQADLARFESACEAIEVPGAQLKLNGERKDPKKPVRRCGEWVQDAKVKVIADGILQVGAQTELPWWDISCSSIKYVTLD